MLEPKDALIAKMFLTPKQSPAPQSSVKVSETNKPVRGDGGGRTDEVDAVIEDEDSLDGAPTPAKLSKDEFVVRADVLRKLGKGNPELGAAILQEFMNNVMASSESKIEQNQVPAGLQDLLAK